VYRAVKGGKDFAIKKVRYETGVDIKLADVVERVFELLSGLCPYLMSIEDSFEDVFFFYFFFFLLL
jgi:hypothetical protein